jgi:hypothetical protein
MRRFDRDLVDWPAAWLKLVDAARDYLIVNQEIGAELLREGDITQEQFNESMIEDEPLRTWLAKMEQHGIDPTLHGMIKETKQDGRG